MSLLLTIVKIALGNLWSNKLRSLLTMLGIIIGVASVIAMVALGQGAQNSILTQFRSFGGNVIQVQAVYRGRSADFHRMTLDDCHDVMKSVKEAQALTPDIQSSVQLKVGSKTARTQLQGVSGAYFLIRNFEIEAGRGFTELEERVPRKVIIVGYKIVKDLYGGDASAAIGKEIKMNGKAYTIVGTLKERGASGGWNPDDLAVIPYSTAMKRITGKEDFSSFSVRVKNENEVPAAVDGIKEVMRRRHKLVGDAPDDFTVFSPTEAMNGIKTVIGVFTMFIAGIAGISLLVGGIGIMNIMLVTVTERTREIGIRKALGARRRDIMQQFLIESLVVSFAGGGVGILFGMGFSALATIIIAKINKTGLKFEALVSPVSILTAFGVCFVIGLFFGIYPARKAARLDPIEALRHE